MKKLSIIFLILLTNLAFSQIIDCGQLSVRNLVLNHEDSTAQVLIYFSETTTEHINYPILSSILAQKNKDTLSRSTGDKYYAHLPNTAYKYSIPMHQKGVLSDSYIVNFEYSDLLGQTGNHSCALAYQAIDTLICDYLKIVKDTIEIDFKNNTTDLKFTYEGRAFSYPNYLFESKSSDLTIPNAYVQTYGMANYYYDDNEAYCYGDECEYFRAFYNGMKFSTNLNVLSYVAGIFTIGHLSRNVCSYDIVYKLDPSLISGINKSFEENGAVYPNPTQDVVNVKKEIMKRIQFLTIWVLK